MNNWVYVAYIYIYIYIYIFDKILNRVLAHHARPQNIAVVFRS